jgi:zinc D-Ala-D-Ala carboxypeptidase
LDWPAAHPVRRAILAGDRQARLNESHAHIPSHPPPPDPAGFRRSEDHMTFYAHWCEVPAAAWRRPSFSPAEIAWRGTGQLLLNEAALEKLQALRDRLGKPLIVRSAYRSPEHNLAVGGAKASKHMEGIAFDIAMANHDPEVFEAAARAIGFRGFGFYPRSGFMHIDLGPARSWGERFPRRATAFAAETPPAREVLADSRTLKGGGAAGVATIGAAGVEMAQEALPETQRDPPADPVPRHLAVAIHRHRARRYRSGGLRAAG